MIICMMMEQAIRNQINEKYDLNIVTYDHPDRLRTESYDRSNIKWRNTLY